MHHNDAGAPDPHARPKAPNESLLAAVQGETDVPNAHGPLGPSQKDWSLLAPSPAVARLPRHLVRLVLALAGERSDLAQIIDDFHHLERWLDTSTTEATADETAAVRRLIDLLSAEIAMTVPETTEQLAAKDIAIGGCMPRDLIHASLVKMVRSALDEDVRRVRVNRSLPVVLTDLLKAPKRKK